MGLFNFGQSKQSSQSSSNAYGYQGSLSDSFSTSTSSSRSGGQSSSSQSIAFEDLFRELYGGAAGAAGKVAMLAPGLTEQADMLFSGGLSFLDQLQGGPASEYTDARLTDTSARDAQLEALSEGLGALFRDELNPAISARHVATGTLGGRRQGVAQAQAAEGIARQYTQGAASILATDQAQRDAVAQAAMQSNVASATAGLGALPGLLGVAQGGFGAELAPYQALAQILGGPTVLGSSQSTQFGESDAESIAQAIARSFGEDFSTSQSSSKGKSLSFGFGGFGGGGTS